MTVHTKQTVVKWVIPTETAVLVMIKISYIE